MRITFSFQVYLKCLENSQMQVPWAGIAQNWRKAPFIKAGQRQGV